MLQRYFQLAEHQTSVRTEFLAGVTTFLTMAYIIVLQPAILSGAMSGRPTGMDFGAILVATCLSAALATAIMGLYARYPIAQAPGMGENYFFVFSVIPAAAAAGFVNPWQVALGIVFVSGVLFLLLSIIGLRQMIFDSISPSLKNGITAGIGLFITFIGLQNAGIVVKDPGTAVKLHPHLGSPDTIVFITGLLTAAVLSARKVRGATLWAIMLATLMSICMKCALNYAPESLIKSHDIADSMLVKQFSIATSIVAVPPPISPTLLKLDILGALTPVMLPFVFVFLFMLTFDAIGTMIGVCEQAGLMKNGKLPRARQAMVSDAIGTVVGAGLGTSTVTSFIESGAGVEQGGRTGLTALFVSGFFILAIFFHPLAQMIGSYPPITAPALVIVGAMMLQSVTRIEWQDPAQSLPALLAITGIPFSYSIADGFTLGFIAYPAVMMLSGRGKEISWLNYLLAIVLVAYFIFVRSKMG